MPKSAIIISEGLEAEINKNDESVSALVPNSAISESAQKEQPEEILE